MAKVDEILLHIEGKQYKYNINVGKAGIFKCALDWNVADVLGIQSKMEYTKLEDLKSAILNPYHDFLESQKIEETLISIRYKSSGAYKKDLIIITSQQLMLYFV